MDRAEWLWNVPSHPIERVAMCVRHLCDLVEQIERNGDGRFSEGAVDWQNAWMGVWALAINSWAWAMMAVPSQAIGFQAKGYGGGEVEQRSAWRRNDTTSGHADVS
ncbi:hypothetical protein [Burkholderia cenocepacia]|uniref:hypothetical protein n=1 Tax=Burkholderia cenocepacia TaxID=95486 RepID=UPI000F5B66DA|nr:hypothetical protein [Burkholderia cenocepacia]